MGRSRSGPFEDVASDYDRWYDTPEGTRVLAEELECLRLVVPEISGRWLEIGVGTGRFASGLGIAHGLDSSAAMLRIAVSRGVAAQIGVAEHLPYKGRSFDGVLMVATLCFVSDVSRVLVECGRILRRGGMLLVGQIPADGPWGRYYVKKARDGHPVYSHARFSAVEELGGLAASQGFTLVDAASALFWAPGSAPSQAPGIAHRIVPCAGFVALKMRAPIL